VYTVSFNTPESGETTPDNGFQGSTSTQYSLSNNVTQQVDALLEPVRQTVQVTVTKTSDDDLSNMTPSLHVVSDLQGRPILWGPQTHPSPVSGDSPGSTTATYTFTNVPAACWQFFMADNPPAVHTGSLSLDSGAGGCTTGFEVSGLQSPATDATPGYSITEHVLTIARTITPNLTADNGSAATFTLKVHSGSTDVFIDGSVGTGSSSSTIYLAPGHYTVDLSLNSGVGGFWWPTASTWTYSADLSTGSDTGAAVSATEAPAATLTMNSYTASHSGTTMDATHALTVTAVCQQAQDLPAGCGTGSTAPTADDTGSGVVFSGLAPGTWKIFIKGNPKTGPNVNTSLTVQMAGADQTLSWP
jgi:hypothetical protein